MTDMTQTTKTYDVSMRRFDLGPRLTTKEEAEGSLKSIEE